MKPALIRSETLWVGGVRNQRAMAGSARLRILPLERSGIESGTMRIETPAACRGVTREAVPFGVAGYATLQVLTGSLSVIEEERLLRIVKSAAPKATGRCQSRVEVTVGAELGLVVAFAAGALPGIGRGRMGTQETGRVVARWGVGRTGTMTVETGGAGVACRAALRPCRSGSRMGFGEVEAMRHGPLPHDLGAASPAGGRSRNGLDAQG